jgi:hypothetical protein
MHDFESHCYFKYLAGDGKLILARDLELLMYNSTYRINLEMIHDIMVHAQRSSYSDEVVWTYTDLLRYLYQSP